MTLLLCIIYLGFVALGLPDSLFGTAWPILQPQLDVPLSFAGFVTMTISGGTILASLLSDRLTYRFGAAKVTAFSVLATALALLGFSKATAFWQLVACAVPLGLGAGAVDAALNNYVALHFSSRHMSWLHCFWGVGASVSPYIMGFWLSRDLRWDRGYLTVGCILAVMSVLLFLSLPLWKLPRCPAFFMCCSAFSPIARSRASLLFGQAATLCANVPCRRRAPHGSPRCFISA